MQQTNETCDRLIKEFTEHYMEKLFYFCLKKTGNHADAEDLTQDIALQIVVSLNKGVIPTSFSAWVWQIARNRYCVWAKEKHRRNESVTGADIGDYEISDGGENTLDNMIHAEQMALLRRELAFVGSDYRNIVVAYYIENQSVREIASSLSLPVNTVKSKLFRARELLKEGMSMAREFGKRSYQPEHVSFAASGSQPSGLPWRVVNRKIPNNILLHASNNPSTLEELSVELGVALPYMEEEVEILHRATLLEKQGDKYITNFFILEKDCRIEVYRALREGAHERSRLIREFMDDTMCDIRALGIAGEHLDDNVIRWRLVPHVIDSAMEHMGKGQNVFDAPKRANGESWGFVGYEETELPENTVMGHNVYGNNHNTFWVYKCNDYHLWDQCGDPGFDEVILLCDCIRKNRLISSFTDAERTVWLRIDGRYAHASEDGHVVPDVLVLTEETAERLGELLRGHKHFETLVRNAAEAYDRVETIFKKYSHKVLHKHMGYYVRMELYAMRMMAIHDLVEAGVLTLPEDVSKSTLGMLAFVH